MSLRVRLALTFALVVALSLLVAAASLFALLRGYSARLVQTRLDDVAVVIAVQARAMLARGQTPPQVLDFLTEQAERLELRILLLDRQGQVLREAGRGPSLLGLRLQLDAEGLVGQARQPVRGRFTSPRDNQVYLYSGVTTGPAPGRLVEANGVLVVAQPEGSLLATLGPLVARLGAAAAAGLLAGLVAAILLARWLGRPLARLLAATQAMSRGESGARVEVSGPPELARLSESFNTLAAETERSRALVQRFVSTLSHELRTPLTSIRGFAQAVLDGSAAGPDELQRAMRVVDREARRMQRLTAELLDLSRLQAGQVPMRRETVDLAELARRTAEVLETRAQEQRVQLVLELAPSLPVEGDADRLEQVLANLLDNALKFTPPGAAIRLRGRFVGVAPRRAPSSGQTGELRLFGRPRTPPPAPRRCALVEVVNPGPTIPPDELPRIFEQFFTGDRGGRRGGTGLGLPIAREIVRAHGGELTAESEAGQTTFRLLVPVGERRDEPVTQPLLTTGAGS